MAFRELTQPKKPDGRRMTKGERRKQKKTKTPRNQKGKEGCNYKFSYTYSTICIFLRIANPYRVSLIITGKEKTVCYAAPFYHCRS